MHRRSWPWVRLAIGGMVIAIGIAATSTGTARAADPPTIADFQDFHQIPVADGDPPVNPNGPWWGPVSDHSRPMVVIYATFSNYGMLPEQDVAWMADRFFGTGRDSVREYFEAASFGDWTFTQATESEGVANDGIVSLQFGNYNDFADSYEQNKRALEAADAFVDFASFDENKDGVLTNEELLVFYIRPSMFAFYGNTTPVWETCGAARPSSPSGLTLDGLSVPSPAYAISWGVSDTNTWTLAHEIAHQAFRMPDLYPYGADDFGLGGSTCRRNSLEQVYQAPHAYERLHLGWGDPSLVTEDGIYAIPDATVTGRYLVLANTVVRSIAEYFTVENRERVATTYDSNVPGSGLVVTHVRDDYYRRDAAKGKLVEFVTQPNRRADLTYLGMTEPAMSVRDISDPGEIMTAFIDGPGPGAYMPPNPIGGTVSLVAGTEGFLLVPVEYTGDPGTSGTVVVKAENLPDGWTSRMVEVTIADHVPTIVQVPVTPAVDAAERVEVEIVVRAAAKKTAFTLTQPLDRPATVRVSLVDADMENATDPMYAEAGVPGHLEVKVTDHDTGASLFGAPVTFELRNSDSIAFTATTTVDEDGYAGVTTPGLPQGAYLLNVSMPRFDQYRRTGLSDLSFNVMDLPPVISAVPQDLHAEATGPSGTAVLFAAPTAHDGADGDLSVACTPASGTVFPLGDTHIACSATDSSGLIATAGFIVSVVDTTGPAMTSSFDRTAEASGPGGAVVTYPVPAAVDVVDGPATVTCIPVSGSTFPLGATSVTCSAADTLGNRVTSSFKVSVMDTTPPVLELPGPITVDATMPGGIVVTYSATAVDVVDGAVALVCLPPSGVSFPIGTATVTCEVADRAGNHASDDFAVTVKGAPAQIAELSTDVRALRISSGVETALTSQLRAAEKALKAGDLVTARARVQDFATTVTAQAGKKLTAVMADALLADANRILVVLGGMNR